MIRGGRNRTFLAIVVLLLGHTTLRAQEEREYIRKGNRLYQKSEFAGSEGMYRRAQGQEKASDDAVFNLGDALYKQGRFSEAANEFSKSASTNEDDVTKQAESFYNLGNSLVKEQKFDESIEAYINSLKLNPDNLAAKYNLAYAQDQLKKQEEQQQQQQDQNKDQNKDENKQDENKPEQQQDDKDKKDQQGEPRQQPSISRDDAKRLLDALAENEKKTQEKVQNEKAAKAKVRVIKNW